MSNISKFIAITSFALALLIALFLGAFWGSLYAPMHYNNTSSYYEDDDNAKSKNKNGLPNITGIDDFTEKIIARPQPQNRNEIEQRQLAAQESISVFSYWMFLVVILQTVLSGGALFALITDLRQNRQSNQTSLRAYLSFGEFNSSVYQSKNFAGGKRLEFDTIVMNGGQTPAYKCLHYGNAVVLTKIEAKQYFQKTKKNSLRGISTPYVVHNSKQANAAFYSCVRIRWMQQTCWARAA